MPKLLIQIPCYNEEQALPRTLADLPRQVAGFDSVEWLVVDDGSTDRTAEVARQAGADHVVSLPRNQGLARAFQVGLEACLRVGADVIVNTDADNQYDATCIPALVAPIVAGRAQIVIGERPIMGVEHFSLVKKFLQRLGSAAVRIASKTRIPDAPSGFRAMHAEAALSLCVFSSYTYTLETIIQAGRKNMAIASVPVAVNGPTRPSRLVRSMPSYVRRSLLTIMRIFILYKPLRFFLYLGTLFALPGLVIGLRFLLLYLQGDGQGHVQSLILAGVLVLTAVVIYAAGILADLVAANRALLEEMRTRQLRSDVDRARERQGLGQIGQRT